MNQIDKIRAEIERRKKAIHATLFNDEFDSLLAFLDTLEEKSEIPTNLDLEKEIDDAGKDVLRKAHYHNKIFDIPQTMFDDVQLMDIFKAGVYKGYELVRNAK